MTNATAEVITFNYSTTAGTATGGGTDFETQSSQQHTISALASNSSIMIPLTNDLFYEGNETFTVG